MPYIYIHVLAEEHPGLGAAEVAEASPRGVREEMRSGTGSRARGEAGVAASTNRQGSLTRRAMYIPVEGFLSISLLPLTLFLVVVARGGGEGEWYGTLDDIFERACLLNLSPPTWTRLLPRRHSPVGFSPFVTSHNCTEIHVGTPSFLSLSARHNLPARPFIPLSPNVESIAARNTYNRHLAQEGSHND